MSQATNQDIDWDAYSYLASSTYRRSVAEELHDDEKTPSEIEAEVPIHWGHVSRALTQLRDNDLAELLVPEDTKKGRVYGLTEKGEQTLAALQERDDA